MRINRKALCTVGIVCAVFWKAASVDTVCIAPIVCYTADNRKAEQLENPGVTIEKALDQFLFGGLLSFRVFSENDYGNIASVTDAARVCRVSGNRYVLYGYVRSSDVSWTGELRLYDHTEGSVVQSFFSADDIEHYDRFITVFVDRIVSYFNVFLGLEKDDRTLKSLRPFEIRLPFGISYWSPIEGNWNARLLGIVGSDVGVELFPKMKKLLWRDMSIEFSFVLTAGYTCGIGNPAAYKAGYHGVSISAPLMCYLCIHDPHSVYIGFGPLYELDILTIDKKYEKTATYIQNQFGATIHMGYRYRLNEEWALFTSVEFDMYFTKNSFTTIKPNIGATYRLYRGAL